MVVVMMIMFVMVPPVMSPKISVIPVSAALVVSMNPVMMLIVAGDPDPVPSIIPELWAVLVIRAVADVNFK